MTKHLTRFCLAALLALASISIAQTAQPCDLNHRLAPNASCSTGVLIVTDPGRGVIGYKLTNSLTHSIFIRFTQVNSAPLDFVLSPDETKLVGTDADFRFFICTDPAKKAYVTGTNDEPIPSTPKDGVECK